MEIQLSRSGALTPEPDREADMLWTSDSPLLPREQEAEGEEGVDVS